MNNNFYNKPRNNNYKPKTHNNKRNTYQKNLFIKIPVSYTGIAENGIEFDPDSFLDIIDDLQTHNVFSKISIPVYMSFSYISGNSNDTWKAIVGYIRYFNHTNAEVVIYKKSIDAFNKIKSPIIIPRVILNKDNTVKTIIGLDIVEDEHIVIDL